MARPPKDPSQLRKRWDALYVTDVERACVTAAAAAAGLSVSRYFLSLHTGGHIVNRDDWRQNIQLLSTVTRQLEDIARSIGTASDADAGGGPPHCLKIATSLLSLERLIRDAVMPWQAGEPPIAFENEDAGPC